MLVVEDLPEALAEGVTYVQVTDTSRAMGQIAAHFYGHPSEQLRLVGVTGTNGKTTIASLSYQLFRQLGYKVGLISTIAIYIDQEREETHNTTPDVLTLNKVLRRMVDQGVTHCFMEVSSHGTRPAPYRRRGFCRRGVHQSYARPLGFPWRPLLSIAIRRKSSLTICQKTAFCADQYRG